MAKSNWKKQVKTLDDWFSRYIRLKYTYKEIVFCYTGGGWSHPKDLQCGHFISRAKLNTRWDENNCRPQSFQHNIYKEGNKPVFGRRLQREGVDIDLLLAKSNGKFDRSMMFVLIEHYKNEVKKLLKEKGIEKWW